MSDSDAYHDNVQRISELSDRDIDLLLAGQSPSDGNGVDDLAAMIREVKQVLQQGPSEETAARHLAAILEAATSGAAEAAVDRAPSGVQPSGPDAQRRGHRRTRRKLLLSAGIIGATLATFGGAAWAGVLPGPIQRAVADLASHVGISLPGTGNDRDDGPTNDRNDGPTHDRDDRSIDDAEGSPLPIDNHDLVQPPIEIRGDDATGGTARESQHDTNLTDGVIATRDGGTVQGQTDTPGEGQTDTPGEGQTDTPGEGQTDTPGEGQTGTPGEGQTGTPGEGQTDTPGEGQTDTPGEGQTGTPGEGQTGTPGEGQTDSPGQGQSGEDPSGPDGDGVQGGGGQGP